MPRSHCARRRRWHNSSSSSSNRPVRSHPSPHARREARLTPLSRYGRTRRTSRLPEDSVKSMTGSMFTKRRLRRLRLSRPAIQLFATRRLFSFLCRRAATMRFFARASSAGVRESAGCAFRHAYKPCERTAIMCYKPPRAVVGSGRAFRQMRVQLLNQLCVWCAGTLVPRRKEYALRREYLRYRTA